MRCGYHEFVVPIHRLTLWCCDNLGLQLVVKILTHDVGVDGALAEEVAVHGGKMLGTEEFESDLVELRTD